MVELNYRLIKTEEFNSLVNLYKSYTQAVFGKELSDYEAAANLVDLSRQPDFKAFGFYDGDKLVGFMILYAISPDLFYVHSLYLKTYVRGHNNLKILLREIELNMLEKYKGYEADGTSIFGRGLLESLGAEIISVRYRKLKE